jgi:hypothetical protein
LHEQIGKQHLLRLVDDQAHGALVAVGADIDDGTREAIVLHAGHGNEELIVQEAARGGFLLPQEIHGGKIPCFPQRLKVQLPRLATRPHANMMRPASSDALRKSVKPVKPPA